ncbi:MAG: methyltransferase, partial [Anaerolineaceae bacterium]|nr:methyltransferase [Anaerolineaceae bacterium]
MNHRERVVAAFRHQPVDRLPIDLGGMRSTGIMAIAYNRLKKHLGINEGELLVFDTGQQLAFVEEPLRQMFGLDVVILDGGLLEDWRPYTLPDGTAAKICASYLTEADGEGGEYALDQQGNRTAHRPAASFYFDSITPPPLAYAGSISDLDKFPEHVLSDEYLLSLQKEAKRLSEETDYAILGSFGGAFL